MTLIDDKVPTEINLKEYGGLEERYCPAGGLVSLEIFLPNFLVFTGCLILIIIEKSNNFMNLKYFMLMQRPLGSKKFRYD